MTTGSAKIVVVLKTFQLWTITSRLMPPVHTIKVSWLTVLHVYIGFLTWLSEFSCM